jgi:hypothetical protein
VEIIRGMQAQYGDFIMQQNLRVDRSLQKGEELLYAMKRDQEGCQRQGLRTIFKPLKEWYGETGESQWTTLRKLPHVWSNERTSKRKIFIRRRSHCRGAKFAKDATKNFFSD